MIDTETYRIKRPHYRKGHYYKAGSVVSVPKGEKPAKDWEKVTKDEAAAVPFKPLAPEGPKQADAPKPKRPSDRDI